MLIEIDGAVRDFSIGMIASKMQVEMVSDEDLQCEILMSTIQFGSNIGFIKHRFRKSKSIDQFFSTSKLITDWNDIFPDRSHRVIQIRGIRLSLLEIATCISNLAISCVSQPWQIGGPSGNRCERTTGDATMRLLLQGSPRDNSV